MRTGRSGGAEPKTIQRHRRELGWSQSFLAERVGVSSQTISNWECGRNIPMGRYIRGLARAFDVPMEAIALPEDGGEEATR